jgi:hypothetical protein
MISIDFSAIQKRSELISRLDRSFPQGTEIDVHTHAEGANIWGMTHGRFRSTNALEDLAAREGRLNIAAYAVFPHPSALYYSGLPSNVSLHQSRPTGLENFPYEASNTSLMMHAGKFGYKALPFLIIDPMNKVDEQVELLLQFIGKDVVYGLKVHTLGGNFKASELIGSQFMQVAETYELPVLIHTNTSTSFWGDSVSAAKLAETYPNIRFCLAHAAGFNGDALGMVDRLPNAFLDCSPFLGLTQLHVDYPEDEQIKDLPYSKPNQLMDYLHSRFSRKLLWGSDHPYTYGGAPGPIYKGSLEGEVAFMRGLEYKDQISRVNTLSFLFGN